MSAIWLHLKNKVVSMLPVPETEEWIDENDPMPN